MRDTELDALLQGVSAAAAAQTDAAFPPERLASQQARILQRVALDGRPARVLVFPASASSDLRPFRARPAVRWIAAAAAAGLTVGLVVGRMTHQGTTRLPSRAAQTASSRLEPVASFAGDAILVSDEDLLDQIERAVAGPVAVLRPLHELTPVADQILNTEH